MQENETWYFGKTEDPTSYGFNDSGIESFKNTGSLVREVIQNSLDARREECENVIVEFIYTKRATRLFPDYENYKSTVKKCFEYLESSNDSEGAKKLNEVSRCLSEDTHILFTTRDKNTTGLVGSLSDTDSGSNLHKLVYGSGTTNKGGEKNTGGSFGIGKIAPLAKSKIRSVFYTTNNINNDQYFVGKSILTTHINGVGSDKRSRMGYLRDCEKYTSYIDINEDDEYGTSVHVPFYNLEENKVELDIKELVEDVLKNFMVCIDRGQLEVRIIADDFNQEIIVINSENYQAKARSIISRQDDILIRMQCDLLSNVNTIKDRVQIDENNYVELMLLTGLDSNKSKKYINMREQLMLIKDMTISKSSVTYDAVAIYHGPKLNRVLREAEPPEHNKWVINNIKNENDKKYFRNVKKEVEDHIKNYFSSENNERLVLQEFNNDIFDSEKTFEKVYKIGELGKPRTKLDHDSNNDEMQSSSFINGDATIKSRENKKTKTINDQNGEVTTSVSYKSNVVRKIRYKGEGLYKIQFKEVCPIDTKFHLYVVTDAGKKEAIKPSEYKVISRTLDKLSIEVLGDVLDLVIELEVPNETNR